MDGEGEGAVPVRKDQFAETVPFEVDLGEIHTLSVDVHDHPGEIVITHGLCVFDQELHGEIIVALVHLRDLGVGIH